MEWDKQKAIFDLFLEKNDRELLSYAIDNEDDFLEYKNEYYGKEPQKDHLVKFVTSKKPFTQMTFDEFQMMWSNNKELAIQTLTHRFVAPITISIVEEKLQKNVFSLHEMYEWCKENPMLNVWEYLFPYKTK